MTTMSERQSYLQFHFFSDILEDLTWLKVLQPEENREGDGKEGDCVWMGDHLQTKHYSVFKVVIDYERLKQLTFIC